MKQLYDGAKRGPSRRGWTELVKEIQKHPYDVYVVLWEDTCGSEETWVSKERWRVMMPPRCKTPGYLLSVSQRHITVVGTAPAEDESVGEDVSISDVNVIPWGCVLGVWRTE